MWGSFTFVIFRSRLLSSIHVHIHSLSALFVGAVNLAKEVVGSFHLLWFVRGAGELVGRGLLLTGVLPLSLHGYIPRSASLSSDLFFFQTPFVVFYSPFSFFI